MPIYILYCKAHLENVISLKLNTTNMNLCFSVRNPQDLEEKREKIVVDTSVLHQSAIANNEKHRDETLHHFVMKWNNSDSNRATLRVLGTSSSELLVDHTVYDEHDLEHKTKSKKNQKTHKNQELEKALEMVRGEITEKESGRYVPMLALDCSNNLEPYAFHPLGDGEFVVVAGGAGSGSEKVYENVDLSDGDWSDYDLATGSVSVTRFDSKFE